MVPIGVEGLSGVVAVTAGGAHACALTSEGGVKCWGDNENGQLGDGTTRSSGVPHDVAGLASGVRSIAAGAFHTCALMESGGVKCWGGNDSGQLGDGTTIQRVTPTDVLGLDEGVASIASGPGRRTCAVTTGRVVECWGSNDSGALGVGSRDIFATYSTPTAVVGLPQDMNQVSTGLRNTCAVSDEGTAYCWGDNQWEVLGPRRRSSSVPVEMRDLPRDIASMAVGLAAQCAITADGGLYCAGSNDNGELGAGIRVSGWSGEALSVPGDWLPPRGE